MRTILKGATDQSVELYIADNTTGLPATGLAYNSSGIDLWYRRPGAAKTSITEVTLAALTTAHADGGFLEIGNGNYRLDLPDAAVATGVDHVAVGGTITGYTVYPVTVQLTAFDLQTATQPVNVTQISGDSTAAVNLKQTHASAPPLPADLAAINAMYFVAGVGQYDATTNGSEVLNSGGLVARLEDQSGNARHLLQSTSAQRPMYDPVRRVLTFGEGYDQKLSVAYVANRNATSVVLFCEIPTQRRSSSTAGFAGSGGAQYIVSLDPVMNFIFAGGDTLSGGGTSGTLSGYDSAIGYTNTLLKPAARMSMMGYTGGTNYRLFLNDKLQLIPGTISSTNSSTFQIGNSAANSGAHLNVKAIMVFSAELTKAQLNYLHDFGKKHFGVLDPDSKSVNVIIEGNSESTGIGANLNGPWCNVLAYKTPEINYRNLAESSITAATLSSQAATRVDVLYSETARNVVWLWAGTNDVALSGTNGTTVGGIVNTYVANRLAAGADRTVVLTMLPRGSSNATNRGLLNTALRAAYPTAVPELGPLVYRNADGNLMVDLGADTFLAAAETTNTDTNWYAADQVHLNDRGQARVAQLCEPVWRFVTGTTFTAIDADLLAAVPTAEGINSAIIAGSVGENVAFILDDTDATIPALLASQTALINDIPTNAELAARTLIAASYGTASAQSTILADVATRASQTSVNDGNNILNIINSMYESNGSGGFHWTYDAMNHVGQRVISTIATGDAGTIGKILADYAAVKPATTIAAADDVAAGGGTPVDADVVDDSRTWFATDYRARNIVTVGDNFAGTLALQPDLNPGTTISTVDSVSITGAATVTATGLTVNRSKTRSQFTVPALATTGTYTVVVTVTTIDGQTIPTTATLKVQ